MDRVMGLFYVKYTVKSVHIALLFVLSIVCYWKMFDNYLFLDDTSCIFAGYLLSHDITQIFTYNFENIYMSPLRRVMVALSHIPGYLISGAEPWSYYPVNLLFHFGNSVLVYLIVIRLSNNIGMAFFISIIFSASFNKADAVMVISHRQTLMGTFFSLLSLLFYSRMLFEGYNRRLFLLSLLAFFAALGSYEIALVMPMIFIIIGLIYRGKSFFEKDLVLINIIFISIVIALVWYLGLKTGGSISESSLLEKASHTLRNVLAIFSTFIVPPFLIKSKNIYYTAFSSHFGWLEWLSLTMITVVLIVNIKIKEKMIYFGIFASLVLIVPVAATSWIYYPELPADILSFSIGEVRYSAGRYGYFSSFGFYITAGVLLYKPYDYLTTRLWKPKSLIKGGACLLLLMYLVFNVALIYKREKMWDYVTDEARIQIDSLETLNLKIDKDTTIYAGNFVIYHIHLKSLLRIIYNDPQLYVRDLRYFNAESKDVTNKKLLFLEASGDKVNALEISSGKSYSWGS